MELTKEWHVNLYNDPWDHRRLTNELKIPAGTKIKQLSETSEPSKGRWRAYAELNEGEWWLVYARCKTSFRKPEEG